MFTSEMDLWGSSHQLDSVEIVSSIQPAHVDIAGVGQNRFGLLSQVIQIQTTSNEISGK